MKLLEVDTLSLPSQDLLRAYLEAINSYIDRVDEHALTNQDENNQGQIFKQSMVALGNSLKGPFRALVRHYLDAVLPQSFQTGNPPFAPQLYRNLIACWARLVALLTDWVEDDFGGNVRTLRFVVSYQLTLP